MWIFIIVFLLSITIMSLSSALSMRILLCLVKLRKHDSLSVFCHVIVVYFLFAKSFIHYANLRLSQSIREFDFENDVHITKLPLFLMERKAFAHKSFELLWLDHLSRCVLNSQLRAVKVIQREIYSQKSFTQCNCLLHQKVSTLPLESLVWLLLADNDDITSFHAKALVCLTVELILVVVWCSLVNDYLDDFLFFDQLELGFVKRLTFATTYITCCLRLCVHSRSKLLHLYDHSSAFARSTILHSVVFVSSFTSINCFDSLSIHSDLCRLSIVDFLKSEFHWMHDWFALPFALLLLPSATTTEAKQVMNVHASVCPSVFQAFFAMLVIYVPLLLIGQDFVCLIELLELLFITTTIWMFLQSLLPESFSDLIIGSSLFDSKELVILAIIYFFRRSPTTTHSSWHSSHFLKVSEGESSASTAAKKHVW